jgi:hypothetical protein
MDDAAQLVLTQASHDNALPGSSYLHKANVVQSNSCRELKDLAAGHRAFATDGRAKRPLGSCYLAPHRP